MIYLIILILFFQPTLPTAYAATDVEYYARIMYDDVMLYKEPVELDDFSNVHFILPRTYFVKLIDETPNGFFKVNYLDFTGYVKKEYVQTIVGTPITPFLENINFRVYSEQSRDLRSEPSTLTGSSSQVAYIPLMNRNLTFYGKIVGEELISGRTNIWYYCKYSAEQDYYGYVYSDFCDELTAIQENTEQVTYAENPNFNPEIETTPNAIPLNSNATGIIVAVLCLPACAFLFMIFKNKTILSHEKPKSKEIIDY